MWNYNLVKDLVVQKIPSSWFVTLIQGYCGSQQLSPQIQMVLISRRKWRMGGTRFNARGIDDSGNVANHTELEQLIFYSTVHNPPIPLSESIEGISSHILQTTKVYSFL